MRVEPSFGMAFSFRLHDLSNFAAMVALGGLLAAAAATPGCDDINARSFGGNTEGSGGTVGSLPDGGLARGQGGGTIAISIPSGGVGGGGLSAPGGAGGRSVVEPPGAGGGGGTVPTGTPPGGSGGARVSGSGGAGMGGTGGTASPPPPPGTGGTIAAGGTRGSGGVTATGGAGNSSAATGGTTGTIGTGGKVGTGGNPSGASGGTVAPGTGGMLAPGTGGQVSPAGGAPGTGGVSGDQGGAPGMGGDSPETCAKLISDYDAAVSKGKSCDSKGKGTPCAKAVQAALSGCSAACITYVDDDGMAKTVHQKWDKAGCVPDGCLLPLCVNPTGASCDGTDKDGKGTCTDTTLGLQ